MKYKPEEILTWMFDNLPGLPSRDTIETFMNNEEHLYASDFSAPVVSKPARPLSQIDSISNWNSPYGSGQAGQDAYVTEQQQRIEAEKKESRGH